MTLPLSYPGEPVRDPTGRPPIELVGGQRARGNARGELLIPFVAQRPLVVLTNLPAARTEHPPTRQHWKLDLSGYSEIAVQANVEVVANAGAKLIVEYSLNESTWLTIGTTGDCEVAISTLGLRGGDVFVPLLAAATTPGTPVYLRWITVGGDGATSPQLGNIAATVRGGLLAPAA